MARAAKNSRICENGHRYMKSSNCPVCPVCEATRKPDDNFLSLLSAPARRALEREGITSPEKLSRYTEAQVLQWHGLGPSSIPKLKSVLHAKGLSFMKDNYEP